MNTENTVTTKSNDIDQKDDDDSDQKEHNEMKIQTMYKMNQDISDLTNGLSMTKKAMYLTNDQVNLMNDLMDGKAMAKLCEELGQILIFVECSTYSNVDNSEFKSLLVLRFQYYLTCLKLLIKI